MKTKAIRRRLVVAGALALSAGWPAPSAAQGVSAFAVSDRQREPQGPQAAVPPGSPAARDGQRAPMRLTLDDVVRLALEHNLDIAVDRVEPSLAGERVAQARAAFTPAISTVLTRNHQVQPPTSFLVGTQGVASNLFSSTVAVSQRVPWAGGSYSVTWDGSRTTTTSLFTNFSPALASRLTLAFSQPLLRDLAMDSARQQLIVSKRNREISDTRFRETVVRTLADAKKAYWDLVAARSALNVARQSLELAGELVRTNTARVDVGQLPPLDLVAARAEQAQRDEARLVAEVNARQAEDRLRLLVLDPNSASFWDEQIEPVDAPGFEAPVPDLEAVIQKALKSRQDLIRARDELANAETAVTFYRSQQLPDLRLNANYLANGIGGSRYIRTGGFPGTVSGTELTTFGTVLDQVFQRDFPSWTVGLSFSYPLGRGYERAGLASARIQEQQARLRLQNFEVKAIRQLRQAAWQMETNAQRIGTSRLARELAEQRTDAERKRFEVGMSTSFLVVQSQRDLAQARTNELAAILDYRRAVIDFEALQEAGPASGSSGSSMTVTGSSVTPMGTGAAGAAAGASRTSSSSSGMPPGIM